jgi:hypothetical protein
VGFSQQDEAPLDALRDSQLLLEQWPRIDGVDGRLPVLV